MDKRSVLMQHFGPKLIEGLAILTMIEINELRTKLNLPPRTKQQIYDQMMNHFSSLPDYDWMTEES